MLLDIGGKGAVKVLLSYLNKEDKYVQRVAIQAICSCTTDDRYMGRIRSALSMSDFRDRRVYYAAYRDYLPLVQILLEKGADPNASMEDVGFTPLHAAHSKEIIRLLIENGADVNAPNSYEFT